MKTVIILILCILAILLIPLIAAKLLMRRFIRRYDMDRYSFSLRSDDMTDKYEPRHVRFPSDDNMLHGYIFGESNPGGLVVFCHGLFGGAEEYFAFAKHFVDAGHAVFMFDNTGCNRSEGKNIKGALQGLRDLDSAFDYIKSSEPELASRKIALVGHSWGGFTAAAYPVDKANIKCVVSLAGYDKAPLAIWNFLSGWYGKPLYILQPYCYIMQWLQYGRNALLSSVANINSSEIPYLIVQGTNDKIIHFDSAAIYNRRDKVTNPNVQFILRSDPLHNKHNTIFRDAQATLYMESRYKLIREAKKKYRGDALNTRLYEIFVETDRSKIHILDADIMSRIDALLNKYIK